MVTVHYFFDPMCGWCFGATALAEALINAKNTELNAAQLKLVLHPGGMIQRREMNSDFRKMAQQYDRKIAALTGQNFSESYHEKLNSGQKIILDSYITAQAVLVAEQGFNKGFAMLKAIQSAHYQLALDVSNVQTLNKISDNLGFDQATWAALMAVESTQINNKINQSQQLMRKWGVGGFPTFIIENQGQLAVLPHAQFYGDVSAWQSFIEKDILTVS